MSPTSVALALTEHVGNEIVFRATTVARGRFVQNGDLFRGELLRALGDDGGVIRVDADGGDGGGWVFELAREAAREEVREQLHENPRELFEVLEANEVADEALLDEIVSSLVEEGGDSHAQHMAEFVLDVVAEEGGVVEGGEAGFRGLFPIVPLIVVKI